MQRDIRALQREIRKLREYKEENNELTKQIDVADSNNTELRRILDQEREDHTTACHKFERLLAEANEYMLIMQREVRNVCAILEYIDAKLDRNYT